MQLQRMAFISMNLSFSPFASLRLDWLLQLACACNHEEPPFRLTLTQSWNHSRGPRVTRSLLRVLAATNAPRFVSREPTPALAAASAPLTSATPLAAMSQCCPASATVTVTSAPTFPSAAAVAASVSRGTSARKARRGPHRHLVTMATVGTASRARLSQTDEPSHLSTIVHRRHHHRHRHHRRHHHRHRRHRRRRLATDRKLAPYQGCLRPTAVHHLPAARGRRRLHSIRGSSLAT